MRNILHFMRKSQHIKFRYMNLTYLQNLQNNLSKGKGLEATKVFINTNWLLLSRICTQILKRMKKISQQHRFGYLCLRVF